MLTASRPHKTSLAAFCSLLAGLLTFSCGAGDPHDFALSWHFEDGRDCAETGVAEVEAAAISGSGQPLYVGSGRVDLRPGNERALLELVFVRE